ncbi:hypothetical protein M9Y10_029677 [Tritrichomonas musculus]|uniref:Amidohydrolase-related domain-containing protein n=1 Tax=Tritrichomonas musculus TaxID=1915356 RepID=A0ABR2KMT1_9EUKA
METNGQTHSQLDNVKDILSDMKRPPKQVGFSIIRAHFVLPFSDDQESVYTRIEDGYVLSENDHIVECKHYTTEFGKQIVKEHPDIKIFGLADPHPFIPVSSENPIPCLNGVLVPGFVKAHGHDHESVIAGLNKEAQLTEWLDKCVNPFSGFINENIEDLKQRHGERAHIILYRKARLDDLTFGITTNMVHHCNFNKYHVAEVFRANEEAGTKMLIAIGAQDRNYDPRILDKPEDAVNRLNDAYEVLKSYNSERTFVVAGADQCFSNGQEILTAIKKWSRDHDTLVHIHSSEEPGTTKWFVENYKETPVEYFNRIGFLDNRSVLAHQVNCTDHDLELLAKTGAKVVHNPLANTILSSGMPPIRRMVELGIPVAISTDGTGSADNQNILAATKLTEQYFRGKDRQPLFTSMQSLERITRIPGDILEIKVGRLQKNYYADFVLVDTTSSNMTPTHLENCAEMLIWASAGNEISYVISSGVELVRNHQFTENIQFDANKTKEQIMKLTKEFLEYRKNAKEIVATGARSEKH